MELIIEQISRSKKLISSQKISAGDIAIGRAYDNDVVLTDPYVCPHHLSLTVSQDGIWQICDKNSVNGSFTEGQKQLVGCQAINSGDVISVGKTHLRFIYPNRPVPPTIRLSGIEGVLNYLSSPIVMMMVFLLYVSLLMVNQYLQTVTELKSSLVLKSLLTLLVVSSMWPLLCSLLARLFKNDARILTQLVVCYAFFTLFLAAGWVGDIISFNSSGSWLSSGYTMLTESVLLFALFWANFYIAFHQNHNRRTAMAGGFTAVILLLSFLYNNSIIRDFNPQPRYNGTLLSPEFAIATPVTVTEFITTSGDIFDSTASKAKEHQP